MAKVPFNKIKSLFQTGDDNKREPVKTDTKVTGQQAHDKQSLLLGKSELIYRSLKQEKKPVVLIGAYIAEDPAMITKYERYLKKCMRNSVDRGEAPYCGSLINYKILNYKNPIERDMGIMMDVSFLEKIKIMRVYIDMGITPAMVAMVNLAKKRSYQIEFRKIGDAS